MNASLELLKECNDIRVNEEKVDPVTGEPLEEITVTSRAMAVAQIQANGTHEKVGHTYTSPYGENLAYGYDDPYDGWYYDEKERNYNAEIERIRKERAWLGICDKYLSNSAGFDILFYSEIFKIE